MIYFEVNVHKFHKNVHATFFTDLIKTKKLMHHSFNCFSYKICCIAKATFQYKITLREYKLDLKMALTCYSISLKGSTKTYRHITDTIWTSSIKTVLLRIIFLFFTNDGHTFFDFIIYKMRMRDPSSNTISEIYTGKSESECQNSFS